MNQQQIKTLEPNLFMGNDESKRKKQWSVATLNFGGINHSPFEFYSGSEKDIEQFQILSYIFQQLYSKSPRKITQKGKQQWDLSKIDKCMQRQRYSPIYRKDVGIVNGHLMTREEFEDKWDKEFNKNQHYVKFSNPAPSTRQKEDCKLFDFLIFKTFVEYIYNHDEGLQSEKRDYTLQDRDKKQQNLSNKKQRRKKAVLKYKQFLEHHFQKAFLKLTVKLERIKEIMQRNDILFLQDASDELLNTLKNQGSVNVVTREGSYCAILLKQSFDKIYDQTKILQNFNNWKASDRQLLKPQRFNYSLNQGNKSTVVCFVDNFILINVHLSRSDTVEQIIKLMTHLLELQANFKGISILAGGDFNNVFIFSQGGLNQQQKGIMRRFYKSFKVYPQNNNIATTSKKRTRLQAQNDKAQDKDENQKAQGNYDKCRDYLIANLQTLHMYHPQIYILGQLIEEKRLLTERHPFDHCIVSASVRLKL